MSTKLGSAYGEVIIDTSQSEKNLKDLERSVGGLTGGFAGVNPILGATTVALGGLAAAGGGLVVAIGGSVSVAAELEAQLDAVQAVSGTTVGEMEQLKGLIENLGVDKNLKVSAQEAADAIERLVSNGLTAQEVLDGAARSTVLLANATGAQFNDAADIATDSMSIFNIEAKDMERAVDGITSVVNTSKFSVQDYQLALAQGGGVAAATGVEFEDFNTTIAAISPYFDAGADAAVSYKTLLQRLIPQSKDAAKSMQQLGIITEDGSNQFFDAQGNLKGMAEIAGILQDALSGLTEEQRNNALATIFGQDAQRAAVALAEVGAEKFKELQATMAQTDAADAAATRMDNLAGSLDILQGIIETIKLRIGNEFIPALKQGVDQVAGFVESNADSIVAFFGYIADGTGIAINKLSEFLPVILTFGQYLIAVAEDGDLLNDWLTHLPQNLQPIAQTIGSAIVSLTEAIGEMAAYLPSASTAIQAVGGALAGAGIVVTILGIVAAVAALANPITAIIGLAALLGAAWATNWGGIRDTFANAMLTIQPYLNELQLLLSKFNDALLPRLQLAWNQLAISWTTQVAPALAQLWTAISDLMVQLGLTSEETSGWDAVLGFIKINMLTVLVIVQSLTGAIAIWAEMVKGAVEGATAFVNVLTSVSQAADGVKGRITELIGQVADFAAQLATLELPFDFKPGSPTPAELGFRGIGDAIKNMPDPGAPFANLPGSDRFAGVSDMQSTMAKLTVPTLPDLPLAAALPAAGEAGAGGNTLNGDIVFEINGAQSPVAVAGEVEKVLQNIFGKVRRPAFG